MGDQAKTSGPIVGAEHPDPNAAGRDPQAGAEDRPGFDLGGAVGEETTVGSNTVPGGPKSATKLATGATGRAGGYSDVSGSRSLGNEGDSGSDAGSGPSSGSGGPT